MDSAVLAKEVLKLSPVERARIIDALWQSLDAADEAVDHAWLQESQDRLRAYRAGKLAAQEGEETLRSIERELRG